MADDLKINATLERLASGFEDEAYGLELAAHHAVEYIPDDAPAPPPVGHALDAALRFGRARGLRAAAETLRNEADRELSENQA